MIFTVHYKLGQNDVIASTGLMQLDNLAQAKRIYESDAPAKLGCCYMANVVQHLFHIFGAPLS